MPMVSLLCSETSSMCFDDFDSVTPDEETHQAKNQNLGIENGRSEPLIGLPFESDEGFFCLMVEREKGHLPRGDYIQRLRSGDLDLGVARREALDWILKAHAHYSCGPLSICLSINYLDRFLSVYELPRGRTWLVQLLAVACLSLAIKMEESSVPPTVHLQVGEPKFVFEGRTIIRMEFLVMSTLQWKIHACTPCTFIDYFLAKINDDGHQIPLGTLISRSIQLILSTIKGIDFLEFRPSEVAAAVAMSASGEVQAVDIDKAMSCFILVEKERVLRCLQLVHDLAVTSGSTDVASSASILLPSVVPRSPIGVLDAACLSHKSDDLTVGSCPSSSHTSPDTKRRKLDSPSQHDSKS